MELIRDNLYVIRNAKIFPSNTYVLKDDVSDRCIIIDPGFDFELIDNNIYEKKLKPVSIVSTHGHFDHVGSAAFFKNKFNIPFYLHEGDLKICQSANFYLKMAQLNHKIETPSPDYLFKGEFEKISISGFDLSVYNFPGHSKGSCIIKIKNFLFSGDIIYKNGLGSGSIPREDKPLLKQSLLKIFDVFVDGDLILPGHGQAETLGKIKENNLKLKNFISN